MEDLRSARQRRADLQRILKLLDSMLVEVRPGIDLARIATLEDIELGLPAREQIEPFFRPYSYSERFSLILSRARSKPRRARARSRHHRGTPSRFVRAPRKGCRSLRGRPPSSQQATGRPGRLDPACRSAPTHSDGATSTPTVCVSQKSFFGPVTASKVRRLTKGQTPVNRK